MEKSSDWTISTPQNLKLPSSSAPKRSSALMDSITGSADGSAAHKMSSTWLVIITMTTPSMAYE